MTIKKGGGRESGASETRASSTQSGRTDPAQSARYAAANPAAPAEPIAWCCDFHEKEVKDHIRALEAEVDALKAEYEPFGFECQGTVRNESDGSLHFCGYIAKGDSYPEECPGCGMWGQDWAYLSYSRADPKQARLAAKGTRP